MAKEKPSKVQTVGMWPQTAGTASNLPITWTNWNTTGSGSPTIAWQGTSSGATYSAASSVLPRPLT